MRRAVAVAAVLLAVLVVAAGAGTKLPADVDAALRSAKYVYVQSERKSGEWSKPAEIWFHAENDAVYVATRPTSWRVRRIGWKRPKARIAVGKPDGPTFIARGELVKGDKALQDRLMADYAKKYEDGWSRFEQDFRKGFESGDRVIVRYTPEASADASKPKK
jgi:hypothetical protein